MAGGGANVSRPVIPAKAGIQSLAKFWIPAFAGMSGGGALFCARESVSCPPLNGDPMTASSDCPAVIGTPLWLLRLEGVALLVLAVAFYAQTGQGWLIFAVLFLAPDISFAGYLAGLRIGALAYNAVHSTVLPIGLLLAGQLWSMNALTGYALIWLAHIGFDRALGYGLKYEAGFGFTHLGRIGRAQAS